LFNFNLQENRSVSTTLYKRRVPPAMTAFRTIVLRLKLAAIYYLSTKPDDFLKVFGDFLINSLNFLVDSLNFSTDLLDFLTDSIDFPTNTNDFFIASLYFLRNTNDFFIA